ARAEAETLVEHLVKLDIGKLRNEYQTHVYGIYDIVGAHFDERSFHAIDALIDRFGARAAIPQ
ncbi:MAG: hypothetical protein IK077_03940, partial [Thermoguttaceae bacterium]|nr:hypothetical protein [Thermoguttaceae bacterium]